MYVIRIDSSLRELCQIMGKPINKTVVSVNIYLKIKQDGLGIKRLVQVDLHEYLHVLYV